MSLEETENNQKVKNASLWQDVISVLQIAFPMMISFFSEFSILLIQQIFVARIGNDELAAVAVANTWLNLPLYFIFGAATALDTLASQAFGAGDNIGIMKHWMESVVAMAVFTVPLVPLLCVSGFAAQIFFGQPKEIASLVAQFCYWSLPGVVFWMFGTTVIQVLQTQNMILMPAIITLLTFIIFIPVQILFINFFGFIGSPIALSLTRFLWMVSMFGLWTIVQLKWWKNDNEFSDQLQFECNNNNTCNYQNTENDSSTLDENLKQKLISKGENSDENSNQNSSIDNQQPKLQIFDKFIIREGLYQGKQFKNVYQYLKLGVAGGLMLTSEAFSMDITTIFAGHLGTEKIDAHVSAGMICTVTFATFPLSFAVSATILVGNFLGAKQPQKAKKLGIICIFLSTFSMIICGLVILIFQKQIGYIFTNDINIISQIQSIIIPIVLFQILDGVQSSCQGVLRGMGRQMELFLFNIGGFWGAGVVVEVILCFVLGFGLVGIWWGMVSGVLGVAILTLFQLFRVDWEKEVLKIQQNETNTENQNMEQQEAVNTEVQV